MSRHPNKKKKNGLAKPPCALGTLGRSPNQKRSRRDRRSEPDIFNWKDDGRCRRGDLFGFLLFVRFHFILAVSGQHFGHAHSKAFLGIVVCETPEGAVEEEDVVGVARVGVSCFTVSEAIGTGML